MGIYTSNRYFGEAYDYASEIPANEAYDAAFGCAHILADCQTNDMALFESTIYSDFAEVRAMQEGYGYVNENAFTNVIKKIVEMFKKLLAKIKGIFKAFLVKLTGAFKNGKDLVKKYEKQIIKYANWTGFKCKKIRVPKSSTKDIVSDIDGLFNQTKIQSTGNSTGIAVRYSINFNNTDLLDTGIPGIETAKEIEDADAKDIKDKIVAKYVAGITDIDELHEEVMDKLFDDEDDIDDDDVKSASYFSASWIKKVLNESKDTEKTIKKYNERLEKNINIIIDNLNKADDDLAKFIKDNPDSKFSNKNNAKNQYNFGGIEDGATGHQKVSKTSSYADRFNASKVDKPGDSDTKTAKNNYDKGVDTDKVQKAIHALQKVAGNEQEVITKVTSEYMTTFKFAFAQARKVWTAAAAWSSGIHKESVEYAQAVGESAAEQFYINMEAVC